MDPELSSQGGDRPELESANGSLLSVHHLGCLAGRQACKEPKRDGLSLVIGQCVEREPDFVELFPEQDLVLRVRTGSGSSNGGVKVRVFVPGPGEVDDGIPGQTSL